MQLVCKMCIGSVAKVNRKRLVRGRICRHLGIDRRVDIDRSALAAVMSRLAEVRFQVRTLHCCKDVVFDYARIGKEHHTVPRLAHTENDRGVVPGACVFP